ncbi:MAG: (S)-benzoin forming benzil reductase [Bacteroidota bacterium]
MNYYIVTGTSRGIGASLLRKLIVPGNTLFAVSRTLNEDLVELAASLNVALFYFETDLSVREEAETFIHNVFSKIHLGPYDKIALINNAGMLEPVSPIKSIDFALAEKHIHLNLLTPMILSSVFLTETAGMDIPKVILNISSGASFNAYSGWSVYCSSKAGLDMFTQVAGLEQNAENQSVTVFALAPGIIETGMQELIRTSDESLFPERDKFIRLYEEGKLSDPDDIAQIILSTIFNFDIVTGSVVTIDQLKAIMNKSSFSCG